MAGVGRVCPQHKRARDDPQALRPPLLRFRDLLQVVQPCLIDSADRIHGRLVIFIVAGIVAGILAFEMTAPGHRRLILADGLDVQCRRVICSRGAPLR